MKRILLPLLLIFSISGADSQGLPEGAGISCVRPGELPTIPGSDDKARWMTLARVAPRLIGMRTAEVQLLLGRGSLETKTQQLQYAVTVPRGRAPGYCYTNLMLYLENDKVARFCIRSMDWGT